MKTLYVDEQRTAGRLSETTKQSQLSLSCHSGICCKELRKRNKPSLSFFCMYMGMYEIPYIILECICCSRIPN